MDPLAHAHPDARAPAESGRAWDPAGADRADEEGLGEEEVMIVEGAESAGEGLFGGAVAGVATAGTGGLAAAGLAAVGVAGSNDTPGVSDQPMGLPAGPVQVANANSAGINVGPSDDGSLLVSGGKTDVTNCPSSTLKLRCRPVTP